MEEARDHEARTDKQVLRHLSSMSSSTEVSKKKESNVVVLPWPRVNALGLWKAILIQAIIVAANEWEEWTAVDNGFGPRATWDPMDIYDCTTGKVLDSVAVAYSCSQSSKDGPQKNSHLH